MIYQSLIHRKGNEKAIPVSEAAARQIADIFNDKKIDGDHPINLGNKIYFRKGQIREIEIHPDLEKPRTEEQFSDFYAEERANYLQRQKWSIEARAKELYVFEHLYELSTGNKPDEATREQCRLAQVEFFKQNPKRTVCDPSAFKHLIPIVRSVKLNIWQSGFFQIIERAVYRDIQLSR